MFKASLNYKIFDKKINTQFTYDSSKKLYSSDDSLFSLKILEKKDKSQKKTIQLYLYWISKERPSIGLFIEDFNLELLKDEKLQDLKILQEGYQSWSFTRSYSANEKDVSPRLLGFLKYGQENIYTKHSGKEGNFISEGFLFINSKKEQKSILVSVNDTGNQNVKFNIEFNTTEISVLSSTHEIYSVPELKNEQPLELTPIQIQYFENQKEDFILEDFSRDLGKKYKARGTENDVPIGWCSWYYYYTNINEEIILNNLKEAKAKKLPIQFFQIDDGYQNEIGDWTIINHKFPKGIRYLAEEIKKENYTPGIWLAPFLIRKKSTFFQLYPEAILKDENGKPVPAIWNPLWGNDFTYCLDTSHPKSLEFLENVFTTFVKEYGYTYLKLDFLFAASLPGVAYNRRLSPYERYRTGIEFIRKIVGKNVFLLGCGAPLIPSIGVFDGMRIGCDVTPFWGAQLSRRMLRDKHALCTEKALINTLTRNPMHRNFWLNDPDCLIVRQDKNKMNYDQTILMATVMSLSGGILLVSDNLSTITSDRIDLLLKAISLSKQCQKKRSYTLGIFENSFPRGIMNESGIIGIWNPTKETEIIELDLPFKVKISDTRDYWTGDIVKDLEIDSLKKTLRIKLEPFKSVVLGVK